MVQGDILSFLGELKNALLIQSFVDNRIGNIAMSFAKSAVADFYRSTCNHKIANLRKEQGQDCR